MTATNPKTPRQSFDLINRTMAEWITAKPPQGLDSSIDRIRQILKASDKAMEALIAFDKEATGAHGGARPGAGRPSLVETPHDPETGEINVDNVNVEKGAGTVRPAGNSQQQGIRRLEKAATAGDGNADDGCR